MDFPLPKLHQLGASTLADQIKWFYGNDPARDGDYHTIVINGLKPKPITGEPWLPFMRDIYRYRGKDYLDVLNFLFKTLFVKMPPTRYAVDATRDPTWAELIKRKLGEVKTIEYTFTINSKLHLMTTMKNYLVAGYTLPDVDFMVREGKITADKAQMIRELKQEALREQMKPTSGDKISFSDGGKHNDLLHGEALSLEAVFQYQLGMQGFGTHSSLTGFEGAASPLYDEELTPVEKTDKLVRDIMSKRGKGLFDKIDVSYAK